LAADNHHEESTSIPTQPFPPRDPRPIPTPWPVRWSRFRYQVLPVVTMAASVVLTAWLWGRHAGSGNAVGEVAWDRVPVTSNADGVLAALPGREISPHDRVSQGDVLATMDPAPIQARRAARQVEVDRLRAEIRELEGLPAQPAAAGAADGASEPAADSREARLQSLRSALTTREEELAQLDLVLTNLDITAPVSGTVFKIYLRPGQIARQGDLIMEINADGAEYVTSYLREEQQYIKPAKGMTVEVRPRNDPRRVVQATVDTVGATVEAVPPRQLRDQKIPEWGLPVRLTIPANSNLVPGEMVNLAFQAAGRK
jgi:multidrug resistance efflux pump